MINVMNGLFVSLMLSKYNSILLVAENCIVTFATDNVKCYGQSPNYVLVNNSVLSRLNL